MMLVSPVLASEANQAWGGARPWRAPPLTLLERTRVGSPRVSPLDAEAPPRRRERREAEGGERRDAGECGERSTDRAGGESRALFAVTAK